MRWKLWIGLLLIVSLMGCEPTIDTSSDEQLAESMKEVRDSLSDEELQEFEKALATLLLGSITENLSDSDLTEEEVERKMLEAMDGKTAHEVIEEAEEAWK